MIKSFFHLQTSKQRCLKYRKSILALSKRVPALHIPSAYSCTEIVEVIYHGLMRKNKQKTYIDTFVLSKGHGCAIQYVVLHDLGILSDFDIQHFCLPGGSLGSHPDYGVPGIAASTGSLGHGLGMAVGMSYANRLCRQDVMTYVVISDGELQEGSTWEAIMTAANLKLDNLVVFLDLNDRITAEKISQKYPAFYPIVDKLTAFNWHVHEIDGHNAQEIFDKAHDRMTDRPTFVICHTQKGKGVSYMENDMIWHYRSPNLQEYQQALHELLAAEVVEMNI